MTRAMSRREQLTELTDQLRVLGLTDEQIKQTLAITKDGDEALAPAAKPWVPEGETFGARLAMVRHRMGWYNIDMAARECGQPKESWRSYEKDLYLPKPHSMIQICKAIAEATARLKPPGVDFGWLYGGHTMAGKAPSPEALEWLGLQDSTNADYAIGDVRSHTPNSGWLLPDERPTERSRPKDGRPVGRPRGMNNKAASRPSSPTPPRPTRLPRPDGQ